MSITVLSNPSIYRRATTAVMDLSGRLWVHGESYTAGGAQDPTESRPERYDSTTLTWSLLTASPQFQYAYAWVLDSVDRVVISGGLGPPTIGKGSIYDPATNSWTSITDDLRLAAVYSDWGVFWQVAPQLWVAGGQDGGGFPLPAESYSGGPSGTWSFKTTLAPSAFGGNLRGGPMPVLGNVAFIPGQAKYDMVADTWTALAVAPGSTYGKSWCYDGSRYIYHLGPLSNNTAAQSATLLQYDTLTDTWLQFADAPILFNSCACVATATKVYIVGAFQNFTPLFVINIYAFDIASNTWSDTGDALSSTHLGVIVKDTLGPGYYIVEGSHIIAGNNVGSNVVEYWIPPAEISRRGRSWAQVIG